MLDKDLQVLARWFLERQIVKVSEKPDEDFTLRHIGRDPVYFDLRIADDARLGKGITPYMGKALVERFVSLIEEPYANDKPYYIIGIPHGGDAFAEYLGDRLNKRFVLLKKTPDGAVDGFLTIEPPEHALILLVENVTTSGDSVLAVETFLQNQKRDYMLGLALSIIDRGAGAEEALGKRGITLASIFQMETLLRFYLEKKELPNPEPCERSIARARELKAKRRRELGLNP